MNFSQDAAISRIPAPNLLKQGQLQLADASFREECRHSQGRLAENEGFGGSPPAGSECAVVLVARAIRGGTRVTNTDSNTKG